MQADLEMRVNLIETQFEKMDAKLDRISNEISGLGSDLQKDIFGVRNDL
jgi:hypothetical protein